MYRESLAILYLLSGFLHAGVAIAQVDASMPPEFERVRTIPLDESIIVGDVTDVARHGDHLIVTDQTSHAVFIFRVDGSLVGELSTEQCNPGPEFWPLSAHANDENIVLLMSGMPMMKFDHNRRCLGRVNDLPGWSTSWDLSPDGRVAMMNSANDRTTVYDKDGAVLADVRTLYLAWPQLASMWQTDRLVWINNDRYAAVGVIPDSLIVVSGISSGAPRRRAVAIKHPLLRGYDGPDMGNGFDPREFGRIADVATLSSELFLVGDETVMLTIRNADGRGFLTMDLDGTVVSSGRLELEVEYADRRAAYVVIQPAEDANGELPNPMLVEYRMTWD